jgi:hypothetical protein
MKNGKTKYLKSKKGRGKLVKDLLVTLDLQNAGGEPSEARCGCPG